MKMGQGQDDLKNAKDAIIIYLQIKFKKIQTKTQTIFHYI